MATGGPEESCPNQIRSKNISFKHQGYCFLRMFRNYTDQKFHNFYRVCYNFWTIYGGIFYNYIGEKDHVTLDLLKRVNTLDLLKKFFLWVIRKSLFYLFLFQPLIIGKIMDLPKNTAIECVEDHNRREFKS